MFLNLDTNFKRLRNLKEKYIEFNEQDYENKFDALSNLNMLINIEKVYLIKKRDIFLKHINLQFYISFCLFKF